MLQSSTRERIRAKGCLDLSKNSFWETADTIATRVPITKKMEAATLSAI